MQDSTKVILVRHGQSLGNLTRRFIGHGYAPLTELGHRQAEASAVFLDRYDIDKIYSSDLVRACETALHTSKRRGLEIIRDASLREIYAGRWEGMSYEEIAEVYPEQYNTWMHDTGNAALPDGESVLGMRERVSAAISKIADENRGKCVVLFTHATPIRVIRSAWEKKPIESIMNYTWVANASICEADISADGAVNIIKFGYDKHLQDMLTKPAGI